MTDFVIPPPPRMALPIADSRQLFPVRRVYCVGRNYAAHAIEMRHDPNQEAPFFFQKNPDNLNTTGEFPYPYGSEDVHHETELAVLLQSGGIDIPVGSARTHVFGYALALDMTRRDLQSEQKALRRPWEVGKAFEMSAPIGPVHPASRIGHPTSGRISLTVNGCLRQDGDISQMIWKTPQLISCLSGYFELAGGDVILTGTPSGVAAITRGDVMDVAIDGLGSMTVRVT